MMKMKVKMAKYFQGALGILRLNFATFRRTANIDKKIRG
jgi:hypothetical protein